MSVKVNYKGEEILSVNTDTTKTLKTSGKYCEGDIEVVNTQDGGITPSGSIEITENDTYDVTNYAEAVVNVSGGATFQWLLDYVNDNLSGEVVIPAEITSIRSGRGYPNGGWTFFGNHNITKITFPSTITSIATGRLQGCSNLTEAIIGVSATTMPTDFLYKCTKLKKTTFTADCLLSIIPQWFFEDDVLLDTVIIRTPSVLPCNNAIFLGCTLMNNGTGRIYVPSSLVASYQAATNWSTYSAQIVAIEDYPAITGG